jgi:O-antigen/teichoic acid export membrane protein
LTMITTFAGMIINLISNLILIPRFNIYGAVYSTIITEGSILLMQVFVLIQFRKYKGSSNA